jgi:hypothetical protein
VSWDGLLAAKSNEPKKVIAKTGQECWTTNNDLTELLFAVWIAGGKGLPIPKWVSDACFELWDKVRKGEITDFGPHFSKPHGNKNAQRIRKEARYKEDAMWLYGDLMLGRAGTTPDGKTYTKESARAALAYAFKGDEKDFDKSNPNTWSYVRAFRKCYEEQGDLGISNSTLRDWVKEKEDTLGKKWYERTNIISTGVKRLPNMNRVSESSDATTASPAKTKAKSKKQTTSK